MTDDGEELTPSERYLAALCEKTFLRLWSWPRVYRNQFGAGKEGKEVCDLLVVFDEHVIIFSDKYCQFPNTGDLERDWCRWFKKAVLRSAKQIWGAERWIVDFPDRLFLDRRCTKPLPVQPPSSGAKVHRVVVAHGSGRRCASLLGGSGSLMVEPGIVGSQHWGTPSSGPIKPFSVGRVSASKGYVHVMDDFSLDAVLQTLDTISDFVRYLDRREQLVMSGRLGWAPDEEELLAYYLQRAGPDGHHDFVFPGDGWVVLNQGFWKSFTSHPDRQAQITANAESYRWDELIDSIAGHALAGTLEQGPDHPMSETETILRFMAREDRTRRRFLAGSLMGLLGKAGPDQSVARVLKATTDNEPYYLFLAMSPREGAPYSEYRDVRRKLLHTYLMAVRHRFPDAKDVVGIATEPLWVRDSREEDLAYLDGRTWTPEMAAQAEEDQKEFGFLADVTLKHTIVHEYPRKQVAEMAKGRSRNRPCHCGSGIKYKKCCGRLGKSPRTRSTPRLSRRLLQAATPTTVAGAAPGSAVLEGVPFRWGRQPSVHARRAPRRLPALWGRSLRSRRACTALADALCKLARHCSSEPGVTRRAIFCSKSARGAPRATGLHARRPVRCAGLWRGATRERGCAGCSGRDSLRRAPRCGCVLGCATVVSHLPLGSPRAGL